MGKMVKIKCTGQRRCVNEVDVEKVLGRRDFVVRGAGDNASDREVGRTVLACRHCAEGKVIVTRDMLKG